MATPVEMPKLGNSVEECLLSKWLKRAGEPVSAGDILAEIETDKATFEVPAPAAGVLLKTFFDEGALVPVFTNICVIGAPGEDPAPFAPAAQTASPAVLDAPRAPQAPAPAVPPSAAAGAPWSPRARRFAREHGVVTEDIRGSGPGGRVLEQDVRSFYHSAPRLSGLAQIRAVEGLAIPTAGSGLGGMIRAEDLAEGGAPLGRMRETIARRMRDSLSGTAQYTLTSSAGAEGLLRLRSRMKTERPHININAMVLFCAVKALLRMPALNAELRDGRLVLHEAVHLGFACDTERGLLVPVVRNAQAMGLDELSLAVKALAQRATGGAISPDDLSGGTFTVSNLGQFGIESFTPILNAPQVAILGVNSIGVQPVRTARGIELTDRIGLSLTCDHQVIDGAPGARFLAVVRECIEGVESLAGLGGT
jgi:pyruvate dehydrogenase E2 component (dihydrolipoamide acetyltransferase)